MCERVGGALSVSFACFTGVAGTGGDRRGGSWCEGWRGAALHRQTSRRGTVLGVLKEGCPCAKVQWEDSEATIRSVHALIYLVTL